MQAANNAIVLRQHGGPEQLQVEPIPVGVPGPGELLLRHTAIGVNFHDTYVRSGAYRTLALPGIPGIEAAGVVEEAGENDQGFSAGDRVVYVDAHYGAYSQRRLLSAKLAVRLPAGISDVTAAGVAVKGLTACVLLTRVHQVQAGETLLVHAAAGGVGRLLVQWAKHLGARVIGTVGSEEKAQLAVACGADATILYRSENVPERVRQITGGRGVDVVYDSVGNDTFLDSLESLATFGTLVSFGQSSGAVRPFSISLLAARSTSVTRPYLFHYISERAALESLAAQTFAALLAQVIRVQIALQLPLVQAGDAHRAMESRATSGSVVLIP